MHLHQTHPFTSACVNIHLPFLHKAPFNDVLIWVMSALFTRNGDRSVIFSPLHLSVRSRTGYMFSPCSLLIHVHVSKLSQFRLIHPRIIFVSLAGIQKNLGAPSESLLINATVLMLLFVAWVCVSVLLVRRRSERTTISHWNEVLMILYTF